MLELLGAATILTVIFVLPLLVVTGGIVAHTVARQWFRLQRDKLQLQRDALAHQMQVQRAAGDMPPWLDRDDPMEIAAWRAALRETYAIAAQRQAH